MRQEITEIAQLTAIMGFDELGYPTVVTVCTNDQIKQTAEMIYSSYPSTDLIHLYDLHLGASPKARYIKEELHKL